MEQITPRTKLSVLVNLLEDLAEEVPELLCTSLVEFIKDDLTWFKSNIKSKDLEDLLEVIQKLKE